MADYTVALEKLQAAIETSEGAATAPTRILSTGPAGNVDASDVRKRETIEDRRAAGTRTSLRATYSGIESSTIRFSNIPMSYEEGPYWFCGVAPSGAGTPATVETTAYERTFTPVEGTTVNTFGTGFYTYNFEYSSLDFASTLVEQLPAMRMSSCTLNFNKRASGTDTGVTLDAEFMMSTGVATTATAFTGSLSQTTPTLVIGNQLTAYVDSTYGTIGTTTDDQIMSASFSLTNPLTWHDGMDGANGHTSGHHAQQWTPTMTITRRFSDLDELNAYVNRTTRAVRLVATGSQVGATSALEEFRLDFVGSPTDHRRTQIDGLYYAEIDLEAIYDATLTTSWELFSRNDVSAAYTTT